MSCIFITYDGVICFETHYIYFKRKEEQVSPIKDSPVKLTDIAGYSVNNPFPSYSPWCKSSYNLTLYLLNGKYKTFSVKEQSMFVDWLKEKNISCIKKTSRESIIEHISYTVANIFFIVFYSYQLKIGYTESGVTFLLISVVCFIYWIYYIFSGLYIRKKVLYDETHI
ncbi:MAG TPA: hypothetical protein PLU33_08710 [Treponemataceae bacterium]|nr:hypothetical protein [Treponemataceae bacterium]HQL05209.1 hypothetical protein [Treponemataceae bacterium]